MQTEVFKPFELDSSTVTWILGLVIVFVLLGLWSTLSRRSGGNPFSLKAKNLFLTVRLWPQGEPSDRQQVDQAHLTALSPRSLTFVSSRYFDRGSKLQLGVETLPGFPEGGSPLEVEVTKADVMRGEKDTFVIHAKVLAESPAEASEWKRFLEQLGRSGRMQHA